MSFSFWDHQFTHVVHVSTSVPEVIKQAESYFRARKHRLLIAKPEAGTLRVKRGSLWFSLLLPGPETWCRHMIDVTATDIGSGKTCVAFFVNLKLGGFSLGKNFLLEECKKLGLTLQGQLN